MKFKTVGTTYTGDMFTQHYLKVELIEHKMNFLTDSLHIHPFKIIYNQASNVCTGISGRGVYPQYMERSAYRATTLNKQLK